MKGFFLGLDLGGTNIKAALLTAEGEVCQWRKVPTDRAAGPEAVIKQMAFLAAEIIKNAGLSPKAVKGLGLGLPGQVDSAKGCACFLPNLPGWSDIPAAELLQKYFPAPVVVENDGRMAALAEKHLGAGRGVEDMVFITVGTGLGSGIFLGGRLWRGCAGAAGEVGHMTVEYPGEQCACGSSGCLERYVSAPALVKRTLAAIKTYQGQTLLSQLVHGRTEEITAATVGEAAALGDPLALHMVEITAFYLGVGLANLANILNPRRFVLGGGVLGLGELLLEPARKVFKERAMPQNKEAEIVKALLGERAGAIGAGLLARQSLTRRMG